MTEPTRLTNRQVADMLAGVGARLQILDANRFRIIAFQNAAESIRNLGGGVTSLYNQPAPDRRRDAVVLLTGNCGEDAEAHATIRLDEDDD